MKSLLLVNNGFDDWDVPELVYIQGQFSGGEKVNHGPIPFAARPVAAPTPSTLLLVSRRTAVREGMTTHMSRQQLKSTSRQKVHIIGRMRGLGRHADIMLLYGRGHDVTRCVALWPSEVTRSEVAGSERSSSVAIPGILVPLEVFMWGI